MPRNSRDQLIPPYQAFELPGTEFLTIVVAHALAVASPGAGLRPRPAPEPRPRPAHRRLEQHRHRLRTLDPHRLLHPRARLFSEKLRRRRSTTVKYLGAAYLVWVGVQALRAKARTGDVDLAAGATAPTDGAAWTTGFLVNVLNPKAALFFISLFPSGRQRHDAEARAGRLRRVDDARDGGMVQLRVGGVHAGGRPSPLSSATAIGSTARLASCSSASP